MERSVREQGADDQPQEDHSDGEWSAEKYSRIKSIHMPNMVEFNSIFKAAHKMW